MVGTRPEAIKMAPVVTALRARAADGVETRVVFTGQHSDLLDQVLEVFPIAPDANLGIMREGQDLYDLARGCLDRLRAEMGEWKPDVVLVQGDTATVFFASLVAFFEQARVGHVEAGLRSGDKWAPWPEEIFRRLTDQLTDLYFAPTAGAAGHLLNEGVPAERIFSTGNTVVDALLDARPRITGPADPTLRELLDGAGRLLLLTAHRRESFGEPLREALGAVRTLVEEHQDLSVLYPVHPNPNVRRAADEVLGGVERVHLVEPLSYSDFVLAMERATLILSDSGGVQEEAPTFGTPVLVLRSVTERPEAIEAGTAQLVGTHAPTILAAARDILAAPVAKNAVANPFGDGEAGERIADIVVHTLTGAERRTSDLPWSPPSGGEGAP